MCEGLEGPERAVAGRYEGRQTRQVPSALFCFFLRWRSACGSESCTAAPGADGERVPAPTWQVTHRRRPASWVGGAALIHGHIVQLPVELPVRALPLGDNNESTHPEGGDLAGAGARTSLAHTGLRRRSAWDGPETLRRSRRPASSSATPPRLGHPPRRRFLLQRRRFPLHRAAAPPRRRFPLPGRGFLPETRLQLFSRPDGGARYRIVKPKLAGARDATGTAARGLPRLVLRVAHSAPQTAANRSDDFTGQCAARRPGQSRGARFRGSPRPLSGRGTAPRPSPGGARPRTCSRSCSSPW